MVSEGDSVTVHGRDAEVLKVVGDKIRVKYDAGGIDTDYVVRHDLPETCRDCEADATHRVEVNAPGNGDCYAACPECAAAREGRYATAHEVSA